MPKTFDTHTYTIGFLLGRYERRRVVLPQFQRSYSWEKAQVLTFLDDLLLFENGYSQSPNTASYFLGSIVIIEQEESLLLLDGQQRLGTATIILAAMRDLARTLDKAKFTKGGDLARDIQRELIEKDTDPITFSLELSELDEPYFQNAIKGDPPLVPLTKLRSHQLIQSAYAIAKQKLSDRIAGKTSDESIKILKTIRDALSKGMTLIGIIVQNEDDAFTIFETLNDRGLRLSVPDLVLNLLMRKAKSAQARRQVRQHWNSMLRVLGRRDVSRFIRHLWVSYNGDLKNEGLFSAIRKQLESKNIESVNFAELCADECEDYVAILETNIPLQTSLGQHNLEGIVKYLRISTAPPLLLAGYRSLNKADYEKLLQFLINIHIRYVVLTNQNPIDVESAIYEAARSIRDGFEAKKTSSKMLTEAKKVLKKLMIADSVIKAAYENIYLERTEAIWLMTTLANDRQSKTKEVGMNKANLEHIFPQNPSLSEWPNAAALENHVWHIGNLTILGERLNRNAQNKGFKQKSTNFYGKSEIEMTKDILSFTNWSHENLINRARLLVLQISKLWPFEK